MSPERCFPELVEEDCAVLMAFFAQLGEQGHNGSRCPWLPMGSQGTGSLGLSVTLFPMPPSSAQAELPQMVLSSPLPLLSLYIE